MATTAATARGRCEVRGHRCTRRTSGRLRTGLRSSLGRTPSRPGSPRTGRDALVRRRTFRLIPGKPPPAAPMTSRYRMPRRRRLRARRRKSRPGSLSRWTERHEDPRVDQLHPIPITTASLVVSRARKAVVETIAPLRVPCRHLNERSSDTRPGGDDLAGDGRGFGFYGDLEGKPASSPPEGDRRLLTVPYLRKISELPTRAQRNHRPSTCRR